MAALEEVHIPSEPAGGVTRCVSSASTSTPTWWRRSRERAKADRQSWDYIWSSGVAGGIAGCVAKTAIAPLDRVKILFQTSNVEFRQYAGTHLGLIHAARRIYQESGVRGLFRGNSATLLRVFPYAGIKFMAYDAIEAVLIRTPDERTPLRFFTAGATSGVTSVLITYPLELIRVRLAYQTTTRGSSLREAIRTIHHEAAIARSAPPSSSISAFTRSIPLFPFYRGFSITLLGMIPYAGVSFLTYGTLKRHISSYIPYFKDRRTASDLACGAVAGLLGQTASYPAEIVRRRMQVGGEGGRPGVSWREAVRAVYTAKGWRGFYVGLSIGYVKVVPMNAISFATWQIMKRLFEI
ncbi:hypothetical protein TREMEDRAFT_26011 [Tremella mesenterica DSM 1558]|uniref:uncharacterized protein n=1 Tax=Tremella mesenterica (strain ATCC 24925 / CBS 8224 / DSM 1558 / NBRC 9311 / NRRL Y-6157 / RJB 2259-6 / UBC 559-6) TaxID=578456 RepID=UPI0003F49AA0|nr:uncharacterized protein TREMEDRAFT_26011 [Tremella mesenterica DSM 1558]EIW73412.1 hypothetical protein TREMEDRAFT_26011 [Tremella mesenterica DSM 1558]